MSLNFLRAMFQELEKRFHKSPVSFLSKLFKWNRSCLGINSSDPALEAGIPRGRTKKSRSVACISSVVSINDVAISPYPPSPALSIPLRNRDVDRDLQALRLSRLDDPFLKVLASRESLAESSSGGDEENDLASVILSPDVDPLSIPEFHKYMVRSPPPVSSHSHRSPVFRFEGSSQDNLRKKGFSKSCSRESMLDSSRTISPSLSIPPYSQRSSSAEAKDRRSNSLLSPISIPSLPDVRRLSMKNCEDRQKLVTSS